MNRTVALLLVLIFLVASGMFFVKPALSLADVVENSWASKASMHVARGGLGVAVVNGKIYAIGGSTVAGHAGANTGGVVGTNEEYDPATDTWTLKTPMPTSRYDFAVAAYNNKIYCIGGENRDGCTGANEVYDPATDTWEAKTSSPYPRYGISANVVGGEIYVIGGAAYGTFPTINEVYDPANDSWTTKAPMPAEACDYASATFDNRIYIIQYSLTQVYNVETNIWSLGASPLSSVEFGRAGQTSGVNAPERIYVLSWYSGANQAYDPKDDTWKFGAGAQMPTDMGGFGVAVLNDTLYLIGGYTLTYDQNGPPFSGLSTISTKYAINEQYTPFGYGTVPPAVQVLSLENNAIYSGAGVVLNFTLNKPASWMAYSLDGQDNATVTGNVTLAGLSDGLHNVTVYAEDSLGNMGASETVVFNIASPFPTIPVAVASGASAIAIVAVLLVYFKKVKKKQ